MTSVSKVKALVVVAVIVSVGVAAYAPAKRFVADYQQKRDCPGGFSVWDGTQSHPPVWVCQSATLALGKSGEPPIEEQEFLSRYKSAPLAPQAQAGPLGKPIDPALGRKPEN